MKTFPNIKPLASGQWKSMSKSLWLKLNAQWNWFCKLSSALGEEPRTPKVAKPISKTQLTKLQKIVGGQLPQEFEKLITEYSAHVTFWWGVPEDEFELPEEFESLDGGDDLWNMNRFVDYYKKMVEYDSSEWLFCSGLQGRLPFYPVGDGDYLAMCMRNGTKNCPVVYLSHDNDSRIHDRRIAPNVIDFIVNWSSLGCCGADLYRLETFINKKEKRLNGYGRAGNKFRKQLQALVGKTAKPKSSPGQPTGNRLTNEWFYQQWRGLLHEKCPKQTEGDLDALLMRNDIDITDEFVPDDWAADGQMLQFFFSSKKGMYWSQRWNSRNQNGVRQILGPLKFQE